MSRFNIPYCCVITCPFLPSTIAKCLCFISYSNTPNSIHHDEKAKGHLHVLMVFFQFPVPIKQDCNNFHPLDDQTNKTRGSKRKRKANQSDRVFPQNNSSRITNSITKMSLMGYWKDNFHKSLLWGLEIIRIFSEILETQCSKESILHAKDP